MVARRHHVHSMLWLSALLQHARQGNVAWHEVAHTERPIRFSTRRMAQRIARGQESHRRHARDRAREAAQHPTSHVA